MDRFEITVRENSDMTFSSRLRKLMDENHVSQQKLADYLGLKNRQSVAGYCNGRSAPDLESVLKIASFFGVSTDYLLGATADPSPSPSAVDDLGLSPKAVQYLRTLCELTKISPYDTRIFLLSYLFENREFDLMLALCVQYVNLMSTVSELPFAHSDDYKFCSDMLKSHGFVISLPDDQANALFSERITNLLREILNQMAEHKKNERISTINGSSPPDEG